MSIVSPIMPPAVREGDLVGVVAPAGPVDPERLRAGLDRLAPHLNLRVPDGVTAQAGYLAGSDERRAAELDAMLRDPDVRAIILARGGYGIARILPLLDPAVLRADPKPIVGFSDGTALLSWAARAGVRGIHGPVIGQLRSLPDEDVAAMVRALRDPTPLGRLPWTLSPIGPGFAAPREGRLVGGNLTLWANLIATPWQIETAGAIAIFEEVGEKPYEVDRDLTHLVNAGGLAGAVGALIGDLTRCNDPAQPEDETATAFAAIDDRLRHLGLPGLRGAPVGHGKRNASLPWGGRAVLHPDGGLEVLDGAVASA
jgi:muramoyltetrapeptide carboxypeptidase